MRKSVHLKRLRIFVACPADVMKARNALKRAVSSVRGIAERRGVTLEVVDWHDAVPDAGRPEDVILRQLQPGTWDLFVGILWHRFGTPPGASDSDSGREYQSGTEEEFRLAYRLWKRKRRPRVLFYRCDRDLPAADVDPNQFRLVKEFFTGFAPGASHPGLYHTFRTSREFEDSVREHLSQILDVSFQRRHSWPNRERSKARTPRSMKRDTRLGAASSADLDALASLVLRGVKETYYRALDREMRFCPQVRINVMTLDTSREQLRIRFVDDLALYSSVELSKIWQPGEGKCGVAWKEGAQQIYASNTNVPGQFLEPMDLARAGNVMQLESVLSTPIKNDGAIVGVLNLDSTYDGMTTKVADATVCATLARLAEQIGPLVKGAM